MSWYTVLFYSVCMHAHAHMYTHTHTSAIHLPFSAPFSDSGSLEAWGSCFGFCCIKLLRSSSNFVASAFSSNCLFKAMITLSHPSSLYTFLQYSSSLLHLLAKFPTKFDKTVFSLVFNSASPKFSQISSEFGTTFNMLLISSDTLFTSAALGTQVLTKISTHKHVWQK